MCPYLGTHMPLCLYACVLALLCMCPYDNMYMCPYLDTCMCPYIIMYVSLCLYYMHLSLCCYDTVVAVNVNGGKDVVPSGRRRDRVRARSIHCTIYTH